MVTVIISTYNRSTLLGRAMESVLGQTYRNFELIVVNNASSDNTEEIVHNFKDERIRYVCHKENKGGPAARNTGIKLAEGEYIAFLDDDDEWYTEKLEKQLEKMQIVQSNVGVIDCGFEQVREGRSSGVQHIPECRGDLRKELLEGSVIGSVSKPLIKAECFSKAGLFDEELTSCQDWDMWKRISDVYVFDFVPEVLTKIYVHDVQISNNYALLIPGRTRMMNKYEKDFRQYPDIFVAHLKRLGKMHCINGTWKEAWEWFSRAAAVHKFEYVKILSWLIFEFPRVKFFTPMKNFKRYSAEQKFCSTEHGVGLSRKSL